MANQKQWKDMSTGEKIGTILVLPIIIALLAWGGFAVFGHKDSSDTSTQTQVEQSLSDEDKIKQAAGSALAGKNYAGEDYLRKIDVTKTTSGGYSVSIELSADDNVKDNLAKSGIETKTADTYIELYRDDLNVEIASIAAYFQNNFVYKTILKQDQAKNIDFSADKAMLELSTLPSTWTVSYSISRFQ